MAKATAAKSGRQAHWHRKTRTLVDESAEWENLHLHPPADKIGRWTRKRHRRLLAATAL